MTPYRRHPEEMMPSVMILMIPPTQFEQEAKDDGVVIAQPVHGGPVALVVSSIVDSSAEGGQDTMNPSASDAHPS